MTEKKYLLDRSDILALAALLISGVALVVSMYEARIMKEQQEIMFEQQQASVWPYLDGHTSFNFGDRITITYSVVNKGVGPAIIRDGELMIDGISLEDYADGISEALSSYFPDDPFPSISLSLVKNKVLSPEEEYQILRISGNRFEGDTDLPSKLEIAYDGCFCSIYEDCWQLREDDDGKKLPCE